MNPARSPDRMTGGCLMRWRPSCALGMVVVIVFAVTEMVARAVERQRRLAELVLLLPLALAVGFIADGAAVVVIHAHGAVAVVSSDWTASAVDRDQVVVDPQARWWLSRSLPMIASASWSVRFLIPC